MQKIAIFLSLLQLVVQCQESNAQEKEPSKKDFSVLSDNARWAFEVSPGFVLTNTHNTIASALERRGFPEVIVKEATWFDKNSDRFMNLSGSIMYRAGKHVFVGVKAGAGNAGAVHFATSSGTEILNYWNFYFIPNLQVGFFKKPYFFVRTGLILNAHSFHYSNLEIVENETKPGVYLGTVIPVSISYHFMGTVNFEYYYTGKVRTTFPGFSEQIDNNWLSIGISLWLFRITYRAKR